jgi:hypothetical protein
MILWIWAMSMFMVYLNTDSWIVTLGFGFVLGLLVFACFYIFTILVPHEM